MECKKCNPNTVTLTEAKYKQLMSKIDKTLEEKKILSNHLIELKRQNYGLTMKKIDLETTITFDRWLLGAYAIINIALIYFILFC